MSSDQRHIPSKCRSYPFCTQSPNMSRYLDGASPANRPEVFDLLALHVVGIHYCAQKVRKLGTQQPWKNILIVFSHSNLFRANDLSHVIYIYMYIYVYIYIRIVHYSTVICDLRKCSGWNRFWFCIQSWSVMDMFDLIHCNGYSM